MALQPDPSNRAKIVAGCMISAAWLWMPGCGSDSGGGGQSAATGGAAAAIGGQAGTAATAGGAANATGATSPGGAGNCIPAATGGPTGMNSGQPCLNCHASSSAPTMTVAGTLYSAVTGGTAVSGATVTVTDGNQAVTTLVTGSTGNFHTNAAIAYPITISVSKCPDTVTMPSTSTSGDCNSCHGSSMQIHLP
jgi:hypothetical protein